MPLDVEVLLPSGNSLQFSTSSKSTVWQLKHQLEKRLQLSRSKLRIVHDANVLDDCEILVVYASAPTWYVLDVPYPFAQQLIVYLVVSSLVCNFCNEMKDKLYMCPRCYTRYCSSLCQLRDWKTHRSSCFSQRA